jgi:hypothetical protein
MFILPEISLMPELEEQFQTTFGSGLNLQLAQIYNFSVDYFKSQNFAYLLGNIKTVSTILSIIFGAILVIIIIKMGNLVKEGATELKAKLDLPEEAASAYDNRWQEIKSHANSPKESEWKFAVIEADKLVDDVLKSAGFAGESMGERLMLIKPGQLINLQYLWDAHKLRNLLVHDMNFQLTHQQAIWAVEAFENVMRELEALS